MRIWMIVAAALLLPAAAEAKVGQGRAAGCLLVVRGQDVIRGECLFTPIDSDGSFEISAYNGKYFAYVEVTRKGVADGYWNGGAYVSHAQNPLGRLHRENACWVNDIASVCAY